MIMGKNVSYWPTVDTDIDLASSNPVQSTSNEFDWIRNSKLLWLDEKSYYQVELSYASEYKRRMINLCYLGLRPIDVTIRDFN